jgi:hypothetical protein
VLFGFHGKFSGWGGHHSPLAMNNGRRWIGLQGSASRNRRQDLWSPGTRVRRASDL